MTRSLDFSKRRTAVSVSGGVFLALRLCLAGVFLASGVAKLVGVPAMSDMVGQLQTGEGFRWAIGIAQVVGGALLLLPRFSVIGGALLFLVMLCVAMLQYVVDSATALPILGLVYLCFAIIFERSFK